MRVIRYEKKYQDIWNRLVETGKNQTFLFDRKFMDYHSRLFEDYSLLVFDDKENLLALVPANYNVAKQEIISHQGLTYGGIVVAPKTKLLSYFSIIYYVLKFLHENSIERLNLKQIPAFFNPHPTDELEYILFLLEAELYRRDIAFVIDQHNYIPCTGNIRREGAKAEKLPAVIEQDGSLQVFWEDILIPNLVSRHGVKPVHSLAEIALLQQRFPQNIRQFNVQVGGEVVAGTTLFITPQVVHCQYISASDYGRKSGALNHLFKTLIDDTFKEIRYFDFGIVNENGGKDINSGMLFWKESFGGRAVKHDFYTIHTSNFTKIEKFISL